MENRNAATINTIAASVANGNDAASSFAADFGRVAEKFASVDVVRAALASESDTDSVVAAIIDALTINARAAAADIAPAPAREKVLAALSDAVKEANAEAAKKAVAARETADAAEAAADAAYEAYVAEKKAAYDEALKKAAENGEDTTQESVQAWAREESEVAASVIDAFDASRDAMEYAERKAEIAATYEAAASMEAEGDDVFYVARYATENDFLAAALVKLIHDLSAATNKIAADIAAGFDAEASARKIAASANAEAARERRAAVEARLAAIKENVVVKKATKGNAQKRPAFVMTAAEKEASDAAKAKRLEKKNGASVKKVVAKYVAQKEEPEKEATQDDNAAAKTVKVDAEIIEALRAALKRVRKESDATTDAPRIILGLGVTPSATRPATTLRTVYEVVGAALSHVVAAEDFANLSAAYNPRHIVAVSRTVAKRTAANAVKRQGTPTQVRIDLAARAARWNDADLADMVSAAVIAVAMAGTDTDHEEARLADMRRLADRLRRVAADKAGIADAMAEADGDAALLFDWYATKEERAAYAEDVALFGRKAADGMRLSAVERRKKNDKVYAALVESDARLRYTMSVRAAKEVYAAVAVNMMKNTAEGDAFIKARDVLKKKADAEKNAVDAANKAFSDAYAAARNAIAADLSAAAEEARERMKVAAEKAFAERRAAAEREACLIAAHYEAEADAARIEADAAALLMADAEAARDKALDAVHAASKMMRAANEAGERGDMEIKMTMCDEAADAEEVAYAALEKATQRIDHIAAKRNAARIARRMAIAARTKAFHTGRATTDKDIADAAADTAAAFKKAGVAQTVKVEGDAEITAHMDAAAVAGRDAYANERIARLKDIKAAKARNAVGAEVFIAAAEKSQAVKDARKARNVARSERAAAELDVEKARVAFSALVVADERIVSAKKRVKEAARRISEAAADFAKATRDCAAVSSQKDFDYPARRETCADATRMKARADALDVAVEAAKLWNAADSLEERADAAAAVTNAAYRAVNMYLTDARAIRDAAKIPPLSIESAAEDGAEIEGATQEENAPAYVTRRREIINAAFEEARPAINATQMRVLRALYKTGGSVRGAARKLRYSKHNANVDAESDKLTVGATTVFKHRAAIAKIFAAALEVVAPDSKERYAAGFGLIAAEADARRAAAADRAADTKLRADKAKEAAYALTVAKEEKRAAGLWAAAEAACLRGDYAAKMLFCDEAAAAEDAAREARRHAGIAAIHAARVSADNVAARQKRADAAEKAAKAAEGKAFTEARRAVIADAIADAFAKMPAKMRDAAESAARGISNRQYAAETHRDEKTIRKARASAAQRVVAAIAAVDSEAGEYADKLAAGRKYDILFRVFVG